MSVLFTMLTLYHNLSDKFSSKVNRNFFIAASEVIKIVVVIIKEVLSEFIVKEHI